MGRKRESIGIDGSSTVSGAWGEPWEEAGKRCDEGGNAGRAEVRKLAVRAVRQYVTLETSKGG